MRDVYLFSFLHGGVISTVYTPVLPPLRGDKAESLSRLPLQPSPRSSRFFCSFFRVFSAAPFSLSLAESFVFASLQSLLLLCAEKKHEDHGALRFYTLVFLIFLFFALVFFSFFPTFFLVSPVGLRPPRAIYLSRVFCHTHPSLSCFLFPQDSPSPSFSPSLQSKGLLYLLFLLCLLLLSFLSLLLSPPSSLVSPFSPSPSFEPRWLSPPQPT